MSGTMKNGRKAFRLVSPAHVPTPLTRHNQAQISRLARESESSTSMERKSSIYTYGTSSPARSMLHREDANRRYAILDQDDSDAEVRKPPTSPYVADSRLAISPRVYAYPLKPKSHIVERLTAKEVFAP